MRSLLTLLHTSGSGGVSGGMKASWDGMAHLGAKASGTGWGGGGQMQEDLCITGVKESKDLGASLGGSHLPATFLVPAAPIGVGGGGAAQHVPAHIKKMSQLRNIYQQANPTGSKPSAASKPSATRASSLRPRSATARVESRYASGGI